MCNFLWELGIGFLLRRYPGMLAIVSQIDQIKIVLEALDLASYKNKEIELNLAI